MIDSHCHLDHDSFNDNLNQIILRSKEIGITKMLTICTNLKSFENIKKIINIDPIIYGTFGIHPHEADEYLVSKTDIIENTKISKKIIGIGETGLDFYYNNSEKNQQLKSFEEHIIAAKKLNIPLIIHSRNAEKETFEILNSFKNDNLKILMHCFTGSTEFAQKLLDLNAFFSASGIITFKKSISLQETFSYIPLEKLLIETDSPFLSPEPNRGKKNEPSYIKFTAQKLASLRNIELEKLIMLTTKNFNTLFSI